MPRMWKARRLLPALGVVLVIAAACTGTNPASTTSGGGTSPGSSGSAAPPSNSRPNVVFVLTDDMRLDDLAYMPHVKQLIGDQGTTFTNYFDNVTLCCPSRSTILRGQYSHNTGILTNGGTNGGFETAYKDDIEQSTIATAMHDAGYRTGLFGKYLNGYPNTANKNYVPPGWDEWSSSNKGDAYGEFNYTLNVDGKDVRHGKKPEDYGTDVYFGQATDFVTKAAVDGKPFFTYLAVYAPHGPSTPAPRHADLFPGVQAPRDGSFNEADVSDKPHYIQDMPVIADNRVEKIDAAYRKRLQSLQAVDEDVAALVDTLAKNNQLDNTYIVFTSDNGFKLGQHRFPTGKQTAYEEDIHLPLLVRGPGVPAGATAAPLVGNVDLAPTFAAMGGTTLTDDPDGRSLLPWLGAATNTRPTDWRSSYLLEHWTETSTAEGDTTGETGPQVEPPDGEVRQSAAANTNIPEYQGIRTVDYAYVEYSTGERELYDLTKDPFELDNIVKTADPNLVSAMHTRLEALRHCKGDSCRTAETGTIP